jgi:hypothetical protein
MTEGATAALRRLSDAGRPDLAGKLQQLLAVVAAQAAADAEFADALADALAERFDRVTPAATRRPSPVQAGARSRPGGPPRSERRNVGGRRPPGPFDPYEAYGDGEETLRRALDPCDVDQLKDIIAEHGMDHDRLALKWKTPERLIERIVETVAARARKGDAFRSPMSSRPEENRKDPGPPVRRDPRDEAQLPRPEAGVENADAPGSSRGFVGRDDPR